ncbi:butyrophilin subfamily 2 member A2-like [Hirundo rustica]|uniref:butyrophilin subfamily 2 member A2-like n=1 Tax=Hirundo rustica TaxID=43150 RepID=UPI002672A70A|nr:butyrophilin subfamily 2 member A2-like [Hirundo rustica]
MDSRLPWLALLQVLAFQRGSHLAAGGSLGAPRTPVLGIIGAGVVLPCRLGSAPVPEDFSVRWTFHGRSQRIPVGGYGGKGRREEPDERYRGRAEFFHAEFRAGNVSLLLRDVRSSDQGSYSCQVSFQNVSQEVLVELEVAAVGEPPSVILRSPEKRDLGVSCRSSGWFPRPELLWLDGSGKIRPEATTAKATATPGGLFSVEGSVRIRPGSDLDISCRVLNRRLNASRESRVRVHDSFLPSISQWLRIFLAVLFLNLALISVVSCQLQGERCLGLRLQLRLRIQLCSA